MTPNEIIHYESLKKQDIGHRKLIKKLQLNKKALKEQLILSGVSERLNSIDFAIHLEALTPVNRISVHPSPRTLGVDEIYDKYRRQQELNAR
tara:strand:+ start:9278 stop:9553 length:276 start_codon:yes stop_codon:yes gene_type:complete